MKNRLWRLIVAATLVVGAMTAHAQSGDERILAAREALRTGDRQTLEALAAFHEPHLLDPYVDYWLLMNVLARSEPPDGAAIEAFLSQNRGSVLAERLREAWVRRLAKDGDWLGVTVAYPELRAPDRDVRCHYLNARLQTGDQEALVGARAMWDEGIETVEACQPLISALAIAGKIDSDDIWWRIRRLMEGRRPAAARSLKVWLPAGEVPAEGDMERMLAGPESYLDRLPINFAITRGGREMAIAAMVRIAREDALAAYVRLTRLNDRFSAAERAYVYSIIGWLGAEQHLLQAAEWFRAAGEVPMNADQLEWRVRAALRIEDWRAVARAIESMPASQRAETAWTYWLARARENAGQRDEARGLYAAIAGETDFYGLLAAEELGRQFEPVAIGGKGGNEDAARADADPGLRRALALFRLDLRTEAVREWNWALRERDDRFLLAAAELARRNEIYDRAINTAELVRGLSDYELRYLAPYRQIIEPQARQQGLDVSWVYGVMRQESRFISVARSGVGAQGLMQVMPATGKWVAGKLGLKGYSLSWLRDPDTNVMIGTNYMRLILEGLDNHPVLASAGYNAGPGRARRWRDTRPLEGAIYAETIPFDETRDYVKKVMANSVVYGALFEGRPQSLKARLGTVMPGE